MLVSKKTEEKSHIEIHLHSFYCANCRSKEGFSDGHPDMEKFLVKAEAFRKKHLLCNKIQLDDGESLLLFMKEKCNKVWKRFERYMKKRYNAEFYGLALVSYFGQEGFYIKFLETENIYIDILHTTSKHYECTVFANVGTYTNVSHSSAIGQQIYVCCKQTREEAMIKCISEAFIYLQHKLSK